MSKSKEEVKKIGGFPIQRLETIDEDGDDYLEEKLKMEYLESLSL